MVVLRDGSTSISVFFIEIYNVTEYGANYYNQCLTWQDSTFAIEKVQQYEPALKRANKIIYTSNQEHTQNKIIAITTADEESALKQN